MSVAGIGANCVPPEVGKLYGANDQSQPTIGIAAILLPNGQPGPGGIVGGPPPAQDSYGIPYGAVYLFGNDNTLHWIVDSDTLGALGFSFGSVIKVDPLCMFTWGFGSPLPSIHQVSDVGVLLKTINNWGVATPTPPNTTPPPAGQDAVASAANTANGVIANVEGMVQQHGTLIVGGIAAVIAWKSGLLSSIFGHRRY